MINSIKENKFINDLTKKFMRSPHQLNEVHHSDAEVILLHNDLKSFIALTTDSIVEEIELGLYTDPYLIGWMTVTANMSDLAAVGASPIGILISENLPTDLPKKFWEKLQKGINDACKICNTFVLGGDINSSVQIQLTGCALGIIKQKPLSRIGCKPGDLLYSSGAMGTGNAYALTKLFTKYKSVYNYKPKARLEEGEQLSEFATSCMDTSDGVLSTLDQLMRLNKVGFELNKNWESVLDPKVKNIIRKYNLPAWFLLAGQHGEFELLFTIPEAIKSRFDQAVRTLNWKPQIIGKVISDTKITIPIYNKLVDIDTERIRNLSFRKKENISDYIKNLIKIDTEMHSSL